MSMEVTVAPFISNGVYILGGQFSSGSALGYPTAAVPDTEALTNLETSKLIDLTSKNSCYFDCASRDKLAMNP